MTNGRSTAAARPASLPERIDAVLRIDPSAPALEFEGHWRTWAALASTVHDVGAVVDGPGVQVGVLLRNRPAAIGLLLAVLHRRACVVAINPELGADRMRHDVRELELAAVAGEPADLEVLGSAARGVTSIAVDDVGDDPVVEGPGPSAQSREVRRPRVAVRMLTSGTTGPPKRVDLTYSTLARVLLGAKHYEADQTQQLRLRAGVAVVNSPLVHLGGLFRILQCVSDGRPFALLERFSVEAWADAVRRHRPRTVSLVPAALRMVLDAEVDPSDLSSVRSVVSGTAPLAPEDADAFTAKYRIPVLVSYAATEFGGGVAGWNLRDYEQYAATKRGSVGRAHPGCALRVVDAGGRLLRAGAEGLLEVKAAQLGSRSGWIRTTDLARMDDDGFLWILGRADQAIIRGGFKVHPEHVRAVLEQHPAVREAAVVSVADVRLGDVPVAVVALADNANVDAGALLAHATEHLARYEVPAEMRIVEKLPRTASAKVDLAAVHALFQPGVPASGR